MKGISTSLLVQTSDQSLIGVAQLCCSTTNRVLIWNLLDIKCLPLLDTIAYELTMSTRDMAAEAVSLLKLASETRRT